MVTSELDTVACRYYDLGVQLGMPVHRLKLLEGQYWFTGGGGRMLIEIIDWWLRKGREGEHNIWSELISSLERMNETRLARRLYNVYLKQNL